MDKLIRIHIDMWGNRVFYSKCYLEARSNPSYYTNVKSYLITMRELVGCKIYTKDAIYEVVKIKPRGFYTRNVSTYCWYVFSSFGDDGNFTPIKWARYNLEWDVNTRDYYDRKMLVCSDYYDNRIIDMDCRYEVAIDCHFKSCDIVKRSANYLREDFAFKDCTFKDVWFGFKGRVANFINCQFDDCWLEFGWVNMFNSKISGTRIELSKPRNCTFFGKNQDFEAVDFDGTPIFFTKSNRSHSYCNSSTFQHVYTKEFYKPHLTDGNKSKFEKSVKL